MCTIKRPICNLLSIRVILRVNIFVECFVNSSPPGVTYMYQWTGSTLLHVMAWFWSVPSHYLNQCWLLVNWTLRNKLQWNSSQNTELFIHGNAFENVICEMAAILSRGRLVNSFPAKNKKFVALYNLWIITSRNLVWKVELKMFGPLRSSKLCDLESTIEEHFGFEQSLG